LARRSAEPRPHVLGKDGLDPGPVRVAHSRRRDQLQPARLGKGAEANPIVIPQRGLVERLYGSKRLLPLLVKLPQPGSPGDDSLIRVADPARSRDGGGAGAGAGDVLVLVLVVVLVMWSWWRLNFILYTGASAGDMVVVEVWGPRKLLAGRAHEAYFILYAF